MLATNYRPMFQYAAGYKTQETAYESLCDMVNAGEASPYEGKIEPYRIRRDGKWLTRWAVMMPC